MTQAPCTCDLCLTTGRQLTDRQHEQCRENPQFVDLWRRSTCANPARAAAAVMEFERAGVLMLPFKSVVHTGAFIPATPKPRPDGSTAARIFDLDGIEFAQAVPFYVNRLPTKQGENRRLVGASKRIERTDAGIQATGIVYQSAAAEIRAGFFGPLIPFTVCASLLPIAATESLPGGETAFVNGQQIVGPCKIVPRSRLTEVWLVAVGCDTRVSFKIEESNACAF